MFFALKRSTFRCAVRLFFCHHERANRGPQRAPLLRLLGKSSAREGSAFPTFSAALFSRVDSSWVHLPVTVLINNSS